MQFTVQSNERIAPDVYRMRLTGDTRGITKPGQFVQVAVPGAYLRRPISVCDFSPGEAGTLELIYKVVGQGTRTMCGTRAGETLDLLTGLGNGYDLARDEAVRACQAPLLVGGGVGVPPLYALCKHLIALGKTPAMVLGFRGAQEVFLRDAFESLGARVILCTDDGTAGLHGFVTQGMQTLAGQYDYVFACGPRPMLKAVHTLCAQQCTPGQYSLEERMACGFGVCMVCTCMTQNGGKRVCTDGPVFTGEEIQW